MSATRRQTGWVQRPLLVVGAVVLAGAGAAGTALALPHLEWPIEVVRIEGETRHTEREDLENVISVHARDGFFGADLGDLRRDLVAMPWVREASLRRVWPARLDVDIREHEAAAVWNETHLVSTQGVVFTPDGWDDQALPRLNGPEQRAAALLRRLQRFQLRLEAMGLEIERLAQDDRRSWSLQLAGDTELRLGREQVDARFDRLLAVWWRAIAGDSERIRAIDLRYPNGFAIAWRNQPDTAEGGA